MSAVRVAEQQMLDAIEGGSSEPSPDASARKKDAGFGISITVAFHMHA